MTELNIALGKPAFMSPPSTYSRDASNGNDGNEETFFQTGLGTSSWWSIDLGHEKTRVTRVCVTNIYDIQHRGKRIGCNASKIAEATSTRNILACVMANCDERGELKHDANLRLTSSYACLYAGSYGVNCLLRISLE